MTYEECMQNALLFELHYTALVRKSELERTTFAKHYQGKTTSREQVPVRNALLVI